MRKKRILSFLITAVALIMGMFPSAISLTPLTAMAATVSVPEPTGLRADTSVWYAPSQNKGNIISLTWYSSADAGDTFNIYYRKDKKWVLLKSGVKAAKGVYSSYTDKTVPKNTNRTYTVQRVHKENGKTYKSPYGHNYASIMQLQAPTLKRVTKNGNVYLAWNKIPKADYYVIYRQVSKGKYTQRGIQTTAQSQWVKYKTTKSTALKLGQPIKSEEGEYFSQTYCVSCVKNNLGSVISNLVRIPIKTQ